MSETTKDQAKRLFAELVKNLVYSTMQYSHFVSLNTQYPNIKTWQDSESEWKETMEDAQTKVNNAFSAVMNRLV